MVLILAGRVAKRTDALSEELFVTTFGKTDCQNWKTDGWPIYQRVLPPLVKHRKIETQRLERTNGILRQQTGKWHLIRTSLPRFGNKQKLQPGWS